MKVDGVKSTAIKPNRKNPSFEAIHPSRYFMRCADGQYREVTKSETVRLLQRKIVVWLNKAMNDYTRVLEGKSSKVKKSETNTEKTLRARLINFFVNNDADYAQRRNVKSIYLGGVHGEKLRPYILTGKSVDLAGDGKPIGKVHGKIRESREFMRTYYGASEEFAGKYVSNSDARRLSQAKMDYHKQSAECVKKLMADENTDKVPIDFYFEPILTPKSKKLSGFQLVNAVLKRFMVGPQG